jgi:hypothetical protein
MHVAYPENGASPRAHETDTAPGPRETNASGGTLETDAAARTRTSGARKRGCGLKPKILTFLASSLLTFLAAELILRISLRTDHEEYMVDEELLWVFRPNQRILIRPAAGQGSRVMTIDERGFRNTTAVPSAGGRRLMVLGDSAMFGSSLDDSDTFSSQLQSLARSELQVVNTAVGGWGLFQEEMLLRREIKRLRPDIILVHQQSLDVVRQPFPENESLRRASFLWECRVANAVRHYSKVLTFLARLGRKVILGRSNRGVVNEVIDKNPRQTNRPSETFVECWRKDRQRFRAMKELADQHGAEFVVLTGSPADCVLDHKGPNITFFIDQMGAMCREEAIVEVSMTERLRGYDMKSLTLYPVDGHPSPLWNRLAAEETYQTLKRAGLLGEKPHASDVSSRAASE